jgi:hypothetical protein
MAIPTLQIRTGLKILNILKRPLKINRKTWIKEDNLTTNAHGCSVVGGLSGHPTSRSPRKSPRPPVLGGFDIHPTNEPEGYINPQ